MVSINNPGVIRTRAVLDFVFGGGDSRLEAFEIQNRDTFTDVLFGSVFIYNSAADDRRRFFDTLSVILNMDANAYGGVILKEVGDSLQSCMLWPCCLC